MCPTCDELRARAERAGMAGYVMCGACQAQQVNQTPLMHGTVIGGDTESGTVIVLTFNDDPSLAWDIGIQEWIKGSNGSWLPDTENGSYLTYEQWHRANVRVNLNQQRKEK